MITFTIPGKPVGKGRPRFARRGNFVATYTPEKTVSFENMVKLFASHDMGCRPPIEGPLKISVEVVVAPPASMSKKKTGQALSGMHKPTTKPDLDNVVKSIADALNGVAYVDDKQIVEISARKHYGTADLTRVVVSLV